VDDSEKSLKRGGVGISKKGGEEPAFGAVRLDGFDAWQIGDDGGCDDGGQRIVAGGRVLRILEFLLDEGCEDAGIADRELLSELIAERNADRGHGDAQERQRSEDRGNSGRESAQEAGRQWKITGHRRRGGQSIEWTPRI